MSIRAGGRAFAALGGLLLCIACDDDIVAPERGSLAVTISGLPAGRTGAVTVTGPGGFSRALTTTTTIDDLLPGSYTITATPVEQPSEGRWAPTPADQTVIIPAGRGTTSASVAYAIATARLAVNISGLPNGVNAAVTVTGPGYNNVLTSSTAINLLTPGAYTLTAANVVSGGVTYAPTPPTQTIQLPASTTQVAANVVYSATTGSLAVTIDGLGAGVDAAVTVTGPGGFSQQLTATQTLTGLPAGTYTIAASNVDRTEGRWSPQAATQTATVTAGATAAATVTYSLVTARLTVTIAGLPGGVNAAVTVTGPGGFSQSVPATTTLNALTPGGYTITAGSVTSGAERYDPSPATQTIQLAASTTPATTTVTYGAGTGSLAVTINGPSGGAVALVTVTGPSGYSQQLTATQTLTSLTPGTYTITASAVASSLVTHTPTPTTQTVAVTAGGTATGTVTYTASPLVLTAQQQWVGASLGDVVYLASPPNDARIFVVDQAGRIFVIKNGATLPTPFLDIRDIVRYGGEEGLLSVAFDPGFAANGRFYVYYTDLSGDIAVARYTATPTADVANAGSRTTVISIPHPVHGNHNGGLALFGPDGMLYLGTGDGGSGGDPPNNAQNIDVLLGKLLRLDVTNLPYTIPAGNPYAGATPGRDEIWARGLRNPWRYAFDAPAGTLYIADVGQGEWEEVNAAASTTAGLNYGWRIMEGNHCYSAASCNGVGLTIPVLEYSHAAGNCSVTGGFVYRGTAIPELTGHYLYADYCVGILRSFRLSAGQAVDQRTWSIGNVGNIKSFGLDAAGEIYILSTGGRVYRVAKQ